MKSILFNLLLQPIQNELWVLLSCFYSSIKVFNKEETKMSLLTNLKRWICLPDWIPVKVLHWSWISFPLCPIESVMCSVIDRITSCSDTFLILKNINSLYIGKLWRMYEYPLLKGIYLDPLSYSRNCSFFSPFSFHRWMEADDCQRSLNRLYYLSPETCRSEGQEGANGRTNRVNIKYTSWFQDRLFC